MSTRCASLVPLDETTPPGSFAAPSCVLVIGNFDGLHRGHQAVLREAVSNSRAAGLSACVLTFDPHPASVVGGGAPPLLTTMDRRVELMGELGVEQVYVRRFDAAFAAWPPDRFARDLVVGALHARTVVVGENFRFGAKRAGDLALLRALGGELGFHARVHEVATDERGPFSSTRAREAIATGDLDELRRVLGRPHALTGAVAHGDERGRTIGFPTANLEGVAELLPPNGVYAVRVDRVEGEGKPFRPLADGVTNIGIRPTVGGEGRTIETYLLDFSGDLYGSRLRLHLVARLRGEQKFASIDELKAQIARDVAEARAKLGGT
jgi:riboflavin kinase/FMN adenylyltransferase